MITKIGNWFFHHRNYLFPILYAGLFIPSPTIIKNSNIAVATGLGLIMSGIIVRCTTIGLEYIIRGGKNRTIHAEKLITGGIYSICRNPMYLGNLLLLLGFGIFVNSVVYTFIFFPIAVFIYYSIICAEEAFLFQKFEEEFLFYKKTVNALVPKLFNLKNAFEGFVFNWKNVIIKEYNSLFLYFSAILVLLLYRQQIQIKLFTLLFLSLVSIYLVIKLMKYKPKIWTK